MREILFRGKRIDNNEWIEGDALTSVTYPDKIYITECKTYFDRKLSDVGFREVIKETVGQYTGLKDKNGTRIFEHDIMVLNCNGQLWCGEVKNDLCCWYICCKNENSYDLEKYIRFNLFGAVKQYNAYVKGNKFDNPELINQ